MANQGAAEPALSPTETRPKPVWLRVAAGIENGVLVFALAMLIALPVAEILLRSFFHSGVSGSSDFVQHFTLVVGMIGGAIAARQGRLLSLSTLTSHVLKGKVQAFALVFASSVATVVSAFLWVASWQFMMSERQGAKLLAFGIPVWAAQSVLVIGFALVTWRLIRQGGTNWKGRLATLVLALAGMAAFRWLPVYPETLVIPGLIVLGIATVLGAPLFAAIGGVALILFFGIEINIAQMSTEHYSLVTNPSLPSLPLFTLAGYFLAEGGASQRLIRVFRTLFGWFRGGPVIATVLVCAFFTSFTGASGVTILALGGLLMPVLLSAGYSYKNSLGLLTGAGSLGVLFPPCLPLILYAIIAGTTVGNLDAQEAASAGVSIEQMFLGGVGPGILLAIFTAAVVIWQGRKTERQQSSFTGHEAWVAVWDAKWELLMPVVAMVSLFSGFATPVEAAAVTALYALLVEMVIYRDLHLFRDVPRVMVECGLLIGGILLILGVARGFTGYLNFEMIPDRAVEWVQGSIDSRWTFLLALNAFLLLVGCVMDIYSAIVVVVPLIVPIGLAFGINPVHLGILFLANLQVGYLTPPVGMNLFISSYRFERPVTEVTRAVLPLFLALLAAVLIITFFEPLTTFLPNLLLSTGDGL